MVNNIAKPNQNIPATIYKPSELLGMFTSYLSRQDVNTTGNLSAWYQFVFRYMPVQFRGSLRG